MGQTRTGERLNEKGARAWRGAVLQRVACWRSVGVVLWGLCCGVGVGGFAHSVRRGQPTDPGCSMFGLPAEGARPVHRFRVAIGDSEDRCTGCCPARSAVPRSRRLPVLEAACEHIRFLFFVLLCVVLY